MPSRVAGRGTGRRYITLVAAVFVAALAVLVGPSSAASATPVRGPGSGVVSGPLTGQCSVNQWQDPANFQMCVGKITLDVSSCFSAPTPETPDSGMAGWFASEPASSSLPGPKGLYSRYGYAGYDYPVSEGCASEITHPTDSFENTVANGEFMIATSIIGASNALRERAWEPQSMWGWADPLVQKATQSIYAKVFTVFGSITLAVIGLYLLWRSRQSDMSNAVTTAGWAIFVMVAITAIAAWPVKAAHVADASLVAGLNVVHSAIGPGPEDTPEPCPDPTPGACVDHRPPAVQASDTATQTMLYRNWLRGLLGSADTSTATKYGPVLYDSKSLTWDEAQRIAKNPSTRDAMIAQKNQEWRKVAAQIQVEDPQAYDYLQGNQGMDRIGAGFIAILSALFFAMFDITASVLVLIGFLIFRWAVIAAPLLGTIGLLRPASSGLRRLANAVLAAIFNIIIFGTGAAIYLFAVDLIMATPTLPGWLQVVLVWLCGIVGWLLLRPYRRITQLGGKDPTAAVASAGSWHRRFFRDARQAARLDVVTPGGTVEPRLSRRGEVELRTPRPESRSEDFAEVAARGRSAAPVESFDAPAPAARGQRRHAGEWTDPDVHDGPSNYSVYRPETGPAPAVRRPESSPVSR